MKIAVPVKEDFSIDEHFGHCAFYQIYTISENNEILFIETTDSPQGCGCKSNIAETLSKKGVTVMLAGGIGNGAINVLSGQGIQVVRNCEGKALDNVKAFVEGALVDGGETCSTHDHEHKCSN